MNEEILLDTIIDAAKHAGYFIMSHLKNLYDVKLKSSSANLVTTIDIGSQDIILSILHSKFPKVNVIAEEKDGIGSSTAFYVDPLDGTLNFVHDISFFAVSIGYWENGKAIGGVIYDPVREELFHAFNGKGAYLNGKKIKVQNTHEMSESLIATGWPYDRDKNTKILEEISKLLPLSQEIRILGSAALAMCYVADERLAGYWEYGLSSWDLAAGVVIAQEAGAIVSSPTGNDFDLTSGDVLSSSPKIYTKMVEILNNSI